MQNNPHSSSLHCHAWQFVSGVCVNMLCLVFSNHDTVCYWLCYSSLVVCSNASLHLNKNHLSCHVVFKENGLSPGLLNKTLYIFSFFLILLLWTLVFNMLAEARKVRDMGFGYLQFLWVLLSLTLLGCQLPQRLQYCVNTHLKARDHQTVRTSAFSGWQHSVTMN